MSCYLIAVLATAFVVLLRYALGGVLAKESPLLLFVMAIMTASWYGGLKSGLMATFLSVVAGTYFFIDRDGINIRYASDQVRIALFFIVGVLVSGLSEAMHVHRRGVEDTRNFALSIVETVPEPLLVLDGDLRVIHANRSFYESFRVTPEETRNRLLYDLGNGQWNIPKLRILLEEILPQHTEIHDYEVEHDFPGIGKRIMRLNARRLHREYNNVTLFLLAFRDVTDREQTERAVRENRELLRVTLASIGDAVIATDREGRITYLNAVAESLTGWQNDPAKGIALEEVFHIVDETTRQPVENPATRALRERAIVGLGNHAVLIAKDGTERPVDDSAAPIQDEQGNVSGCVLIFRNITERRQAELALQDSEVRYRRLFESAKDGILILDAETARISDANPFIAQLLEYSHADLVDRELWEIGLFRDQEASREAMRELQEKHYIRYEDLPLETKTGRRIDVEFVSNVYGEDGHQVIQCNIRDITERKRLLDGLRQYAADLSEADHRKNEFLAMLAHELRNPLAPIRNAVHVLRLACGGGEIVTSVSEMMDRQVTQMVRLVDDLLDVSRISRGKIELRLERIELASAVYRAVEAARSLYKSLDHELIVTLPPEPIYLNADATRLAQVVGNLLNNAFKFTDRGGRIELVVSVEGRVTSEKKGENDNDRAALSRPPGVAISDGPGRAVLPRDEGVPDGGAIRPDEPDSPGGGIDPGQHRRGAGSATHQGIPELSEHRAGVAYGVGNAPVAQSTGGIAGANDTESTPDDVGRNRSDAFGTSEGTGRATDERVTKSGEGRGARGEGEPASALATHHSPLATPFAVIRVRDSGIGIAADQLPRIFEMFRQIDTSLERSVSGLGIGLTLVRSLVELHGGTVEACSDGIGHGSEFVVRLPIMLETPELPSLSGDGEPTIPTQRRILVVDDNRDYATSLLMLQELCGNEMRTAWDGLEAVATATEFRPDVILLDIGLPKLNGYEAARKIREQPWGEKMVLVALTGWGQDEDRQKSREAGFDGHLVKPLDLGALTSLLAELLP